MTSSPRYLFSYILRELPVFWKYTAMVVVVYLVIFFLFSFSLLLYALDFLMPLIIAGGLIFVFRAMIGWRKWQRNKHSIRRI